MIVGNPAEFVPSGFAFTALTLSGVKVSRASEPHSRLRHSPWSELPVRASPKQAAPADWKLAGQVVTDAEDQASRIDLARFYFRHLAG